MKSIVVQDRFFDYCMICGSPNIEIHHCIEGTANRRLSDEDKLVIPLCKKHHNEQGISAHYSKEVGTLIHIIAQLAWEKKAIIDRYELPFEDINEDVREQFRRRYGKSYL